jgi:hypothetical protein
MKATLYDWAGTAKNFPKRMPKKLRAKAKLPDWFAHQTTIDISWEQIKELYDSGINVMLKHCFETDPSEMIVFVDDQGFGQR